MTHNGEQDSGAYDADSNPLGVDQPSRCRRRRTLEVAAPE